MAKPRYVEIWEALGWVNCGPLLPSNPILGKPPDVRWIGEPYPEHGYQYVPPLDFTTEERYRADFIYRMKKKGYWEGVVEIVEGNGFEISPELPMLQMTMAMEALLKRGSEGRD